MEELKKTQKKRKRKLNLARKWLFSLDKSLITTPRNREQEKVEVDHLDAHFTDFKDLPLKVILSAWGNHVTFDGFSFSQKQKCLYFILRKIFT